MSRKWLVAVWLWLSVAVAAQGADSIQRFYGYAFDLDSGEYLYTEVHAQQIENGRWLGGTIDYFTPDGRRFGHKTLDFRQDEFVPIFRLDLDASGYMEGITANRESVVMERREGQDRRLERKRVDKTAPICADSGFHSCLRANFAKLQAGETLKFTLAVAGSLNSFRFRAKKVGETQFDGRKAVMIKVEPDSLLRFLAGPLQLLYEPEQRMLLEFRGPSNIPDPRSGRPYKARIVYPERPPPGAPPNLPPLGG
jgi:hypothetical protein